MADDGATLLFALYIPETDHSMDPEQMADLLTEIINEERELNATEAGRPDYYRPVMVSAFPAAQWLTPTSFAALRRAAALAAGGGETTPTGGQER